MKSSIRFFLKLKKNSNITQSNIWVYSKKQDKEQNSSLSKRYLHAKMWRQPKCPLVDEEINKKLHTHVMEYHSALKRLEILSHAATWINLKETMLSVTSRCPKTNALCFTYLGHLKKSHSQRQKEEWWLPVAEVRRKQGVIIQGDGAPGLQNEKFWRSDTHKVNTPDTPELYIWEDPLEEATAAHCRILAWEMPCTQEPGELQSMGLRKCQTDLATKQQD